MHFSNAFYTMHLEWDLEKLYYTIIMAFSPALPTAFNLVPTFSSLRSERSSIIDFFLGRIRIGLGLELIDRVGNESIWVGLGFNLFIKWIEDFNPTQTQLVYLNELINTLLLG